MDGHSGCARRTATAAIPTTNAQRFRFCPGSRIPSSAGAAARYGSGRLFRGTLRHARRPQSNDAKIRVNSRRVRAPAPPAPVAPVPVAPVVAEEALVSPTTDALVSQAFNTLIASRFQQSNDILAEMVREMLKPMLKAWLDDNLPILVERLVRTEIERVARGGR